MQCKVKESNLVDWYINSYDFEASSAAQSAEIVAALKKQIDTYKLDHGTGIH